MILRAAAGVIPEALMQKELAHAGLTELHYTPLDRYDAYEPPAVPKWVGRGET